MLLTVTEQLTVRYRATYCSVPSVLPSVTIVLQSVTEHVTIYYLTYYRMVLPVTERIPARYRATYHSIPSVLPSVTVRYGPLLLNNEHIAMMLLPHYRFVTMC
jgi:hypothetical protein